MAVVVLAQSRRSNYYGRSHCCSLCSCSALLRFRGRVGPGHPLRRRDSAGAPVAALQPSDAGSGGRPVPPASLRFADRPRYSSSSARPTRLCRLPCADEFSTLRRSECARADARIERV